ncbi:hypothetical protein THAOC_33304, partial [Thalassiosira oceanica]
EKDVGEGEDGGAGASASHPPSAHRTAADDAPTGSGAGSGRTAESATGAGRGTSTSAGRLGTIMSQGDAFAAAELRRLRDDGRQNAARRQQMVDPRRHQQRGQESGEGTSEARPRPHVNAPSNLSATLEHYRQRMQSPRTTRPESRMSISSASTNGRPGNGDAMSETEDFADPIVGDDTGRQGAASAQAAVPMGPGRGLSINVQATQLPGMDGEATLAVDTPSSPSSNGSGGGGINRKRSHLARDGALAGGHGGSNARDIFRSSGQMEKLSCVIGRGRLVMRNLNHHDADLIRSSIMSNPQLSVLKLGYNNLGDVGVGVIAQAIRNGGGGPREEVPAATVRTGIWSRLSQTPRASPSEPPRQPCHHPSLSVLDLGFNNVGDAGCASLAGNAVSRNPALSTLYLSGNAVREAGALALASAISGGCGLKSLHLTANRVGPAGVRGLMRSIAEFDVTMQMARQDRENRVALRAEQQAGATRSGDDEGQAGDDDDLSRLRGFRCMEELYLGGTQMESVGCLAVSNMLLTNLSLRVICLSDNGLNDQDLSLFSQSLSRNRELPLEVLRLSFNKLTCVGVETLMNAIWGSKTLREIKLDNNQIKDRGAQLAAVVLTSVNLEVLDMGFNRLTIVGIKALMKSLAENRSLTTLTLSGNILDTNASKAVSYALAYNRTIRKLYVDHCSLSYAAQRHVAAGIVSNSNLALRVMSGFPLGAIAVTLGLPGAMEKWSNEQVLKFIRLMWDKHRHETDGTAGSSSSNNLSRTSNSRESSQHSMSTGVSTVSGIQTNGVRPQADSRQNGPSDPATVVAAAKKAFDALGDAGGILLLTEEPQRAISDSSPMVSSDAVMLERTPSGTIQVPTLADEQADNDDDSLSLSCHNSRHSLNSGSAPGGMMRRMSGESLCTANGSNRPETPIDPESRRRNMEWLRMHFRSLNEIGQLPYAYDDLVQLHRYFYSVDSDEDGSAGGGRDECGMPPPPAPGGIHVNTAPPKSSGLQRKISYRGLNDMLAKQQGDGGNSPLYQPSLNFAPAENSSSKRNLRQMAEDLSMQPANKRSRSNDKPRIDYFPRIKAKIEVFLSSSKQTRALILLRQLKFVETTMFLAVNPYCDPTSRADPGDPVCTDAEVVLIDML